MSGANCEIKMKTTADYIKDDCIALLDRMLTGETLVFFGEDSFGKHGWSTFPVFARVRAFDFEIDTFSDDPDEVEAHVRIFLDGYDSQLTGHAITDANLRINLDKILDDWAAERDTLTWADVALQGRDFITLKVDVPKLLAW